MARTGATGRTRPSTERCCASSASSDPKEIEEQTRRAARAARRRGAVALDRARRQPARDDEEGEGLRQRPELVPGLHADRDGEVRAGGRPLRCGGYALRPAACYAVPILLGVSIVVFALIKMVPGDAADILIPPETPKEVAAPDPRQAGPRPADPRAVRCAGCGRMVRGDLGISIVTNEPVAGLAAERARQHAHARDARRRARLHPRHAPRRARRLLPRDHPRPLFSAAAITGVSLPHYWVGIVLVAIFAVTLNALPAPGHGAGRLPAHVGAGQAPDPARVHAVAHPDGRGQPPGARQRARDHRPGVRGGPARQGPARPARARARHEERRALGAWR